MRKFQILFDEAEASAICHPVLEPYGNFGFPSSHGKPQQTLGTYANFVQSMDGIASFKGKHASGGDIAQSGGGQMADESTCALMLMPSCWE